jgi:hypothetical protein
MTGFRVRREALADDALVVVRGGMLVDESLRRDARIAFLRFGEYGVSVLAARNDESMRQVAAGPLRQSAKLTLMTAGAIRAAGLELRPTFRRPHFTVIFPGLNEGVSLLQACENEVIDNPHYDGEREEDQR